MTARARRTPLRPTVFALALASIVTIVWGTRAWADANTWQPVGPTFSTVLTFERHPQNPAVLLAGVYFGGLYRSTDYGFTWTHVPTDFSTRSIFALAYDPQQPATVYAGTFQAGIFKSTDGGSTWTAINTGLPNLDIQAIAVDPFNSSTLIAATSDSGIFRSTDAGATWARVDTASPALRGKAVQFDRTRSGVIYVGTIGQGVYRSGNGGTSFVPFSGGLPATTSILSLRFSSASDHALYASADNGVFTLADAASSWTPLTYDLPPYPVSDLLPHPTIPHMSIAATLVGVFLMPDDRVASPHWIGWHTQPTRTLTADPTGTVFHAASIHAGLIATADFGMNWYPANTGIQNLFAGALALTHIAGEQKLFVGSDFAVHRSVNGQWDVTTDLKQAVFDIQVDPTNPQTLYIGTEHGAVWKSTNAGASWVPTSENIVPAQIFDVTQGADGALLFAATTSGLYVSPDGGSQWTQSNTGDLSFVLSIAADPTRAPILYIGGPNGQVYRTADGGFSWIRAASGLPAEDIVHLAIAPWDKTYAVTASGGLYATSDDGRNWFSTKNGVPFPAIALGPDPSRPWVVYLATSGGVYRSESGALQWEARNQGLGSSFVFSVAVDPSNPSHVFAGTDRGLFQSLNEGGEWTGTGSTGSTLPAGAITHIVIDPANGQHLWVSVQHAGVFRSQDGGTTWTGASSGLPAGGVVPVLLRRASSTNLFAGTPLNGIFKSTDGGSSWQRSSFGLTLFVRGVAVDPVSPQTVYAGSLGGGVFKSTDGAATWSAVGLRDRNIFKLAVDPTAHDTVYAATSQGVSRSQDGGQTWANLGQKTAFVYAMAVDPRDRRRVFVGTTAGKVYRSTDGAQSWANASSGLPPYTVLAMAIDGSSGTLFASPDRHGVFYSTNDGASWSPMPASAFDTETVSALAVDQTGAIYAATAGAGVFAFRNGTWQLASDGLASRHIAHIAVSQDGALYASTFDSGIFRSLDAGGSWQWASYGLTTNRVAAVTPSPVNAAVLYAATPDGVFRSADRGATWQAIHAGLEQIAVQHVVVDRIDPHVLYAATNGRGVYRSANDGATWQNISTGLVSVDVHALAQGAQAGDLYAGTIGGGLSRTTTAGATWLGGTTPQMVDQFVLAIAVDPVSPGTVYAATAGQGVLRSTNGGVDWTLANNGLDGLFLLSIALDKQNPQVLYAGSSGKGVFYTTNGGQAWKPLNAGLFNHTVTALAIDPLDSSRIYAGTEGGGVFANQVSLAPTTCTYAVSPTSLAIGPGLGSAVIDVTTQSGCGWRLDSGADWITFEGNSQRVDGGSVTLAIAINPGGDARSGVIVIAGTPVVVAQAGQTRLFRLTINKSGAGAGTVTSDWVGISCGADCSQLFTDSLPVTLTATAAQGARFVGWQGDADCTDGAVVMSADRTCTAQFDATGDFDGDGLPDIWELQFGLDPASADGDNGAAGDPDGDGRTNLQEFQDGTHPRGFVRRYTAAGVSSVTSATSLAIFNPGMATAHVLVRLLRDDGVTGSSFVALPGMTRGAVDAAAIAGFDAARFSVIVESDLFVAVDRTIRTSAPFASLADLAVDAPAGTWYVGPARTSDGFQARYVLFNPGRTSSTATLTWLSQSSATPIATQVTLAAGGRTEIDVAAQDPSLAGTLVSGIVQATAPIVVESEVWLGDRSAASGAAVPQPLYLGYLAEGRTGATIDTTLSLFNPTGTPTTATVTYLGESGLFVQRSHALGAFASLEVPVRTEDPALAAATAFSTVVFSPAAPLVIGRTTSWPGAQPTDWYESHGSAAVTAPALRWAIPSGALGGSDNSETDLVLANYSGTATSATVTLVFDDGTTIAKTFALPAAGRLTVSIGTAFPEAAFRPFSAMVESVSSGGHAAAPIVVERSTYSSPTGIPWASGDSTPAVPIPTQPQMP
jgi:photosystem II stability/assembly factor-like uncharacterized protein